LLVIDYDRAGASPEVATEGFVELIATAQATLSSRNAGRPVRALLELRRSLHTLHSGVLLPYTRPVIKLLS
jgi:hypothetical protein